MRIRDVRADELSVLQDIEIAAGRQFIGVAMPEIAGDEPLSIDALASYQRSGLAWVMADEDSGASAGYLIADIVDGNLHVEQVSVRPSCAHRRIGRALIERAEEEALARGLRAVTLTTFVEVPWNAPYYARCGFEIMLDQDLGPGLRDIRAHEADAGLDRWPRVCMRKKVVAR